jgi:hypothetical protein
MNGVHRPSQKRVWDSHELIYVYRTRRQRLSRDWNFRESEDVSKKRTHICTGTTVLVSPIRTGVSTGV